MFYNMKFIIEDRKIKLEEEYQNENIQLGGYDEDEEKEDTDEENKDSEYYSLDFDENAQNELLDNVILNSDSILFGGDGKGETLKIDDLDEINLDSHIDVNKLKESEELQHSEGTQNENQMKTKMKTKMKPNKKVVILMKN